MILFIISTALSLALVFVVATMTRAFKPLPTPSPADPPAEGPLVSIVLPARNEERNIQQCLSSLLGQCYPNLEVVMVDDESTDKTLHLAQALAARDSRLTVIKGTPLPRGWIGKNHAVHQAMHHARGDWFLFTDADTVHSPQALASALDLEVREKADMLCLFTHQHQDTFWEKVVQPAVLLAVFALGGTAHEANDPRSPIVKTNGQYMLIRRQAYESVGGHEAFKADIVEDLALARNVKRAGFRLLLADGRALVTTRMYASLKEIWQGWSKNMCAAHTGESRFRRMTMYALYGLASAAPLVVLIWSAAAFVMASDPLVAVAGLQSAAQISFLVIMRVKVNEIFQVGAWYALGHPLAGAVFLGMMIWCGLRALTGRRVGWKGRRY